MRSGGVRLMPVRLQPTPPGPDDYRADRADLRLTCTLRAFQIAANPPVRIFDPVTGEAKVGVSVPTDTPEIVVINGTPRFDPALTMSSLEQTKGRPMLLFPGISLHQA